MAMSPPIQSEMGIRQWLFNPFIRVAGGQALVVGIGVILVTAVIASMGEVRLDGLLDLHTVRNVPLMFSIAEGLSNWLVISVLLTVAALAFGSSTVRVLDVAGTQAMARSPLLLGVLVSALPWVRNALDAQAESVLSGQPPEALGAAFVGMAAVALSIIWMVALMWKGFSVSTNMKGARAVTLFVVAVLVGEVLTNILAIRVLSPILRALT